MVAAWRQFRIRRKTGYKILELHAELGLEGLRDWPRALRSHPNQVGLAVETAILRLRKAHPTWGGQEAAGGARPQGARGGVAGPEHRRCDPEADWPGYAAGAASATAAEWSNRPWWRTSRTTSGRSTSRAGSAAATAGGATT